MRTLNATIQKYQECQTTLANRHAPTVVISVGETLALLSAVTVATAAVLLSIWLAGLDISNILGAGMWGGAFIFFALAVDNNRPLALLQALTGLTLLLLAWLQFNVSSDYTIVTGVLMATWAAVAVFRRLK